jgi:hypothetical protein
MFYLTIEDSKAYLFHNGYLVCVSPYPGTDIQPYDAVTVAGYTFAADVNGCDTLYFIDESGDPLTGSITLDTAGRLVGDTYYLGAHKHRAVKPSVVLPYAASVNN